MTPQARKFGGLFTGPQAQWVGILMPVSLTVLASSAVITILLMSIEPSPRIYLGIAAIAAITLIAFAVQQKLAQAKLRVVKDSFERRISQRTAQLVRANVHLRTEIDERRRTEAVLLEIQNRKSTIIDTALDCIVSIDPRGNIFELNPAAELKFGYAKEQIQGQPITTLLRLDEAEKAEEFGLVRYLREESGLVKGQRIETRCRKSDQSEFPVEMAVVRVNEEADISYTFYIHDITKRKRVEKERAQLTQDLVNASHRAGMAEIANGVLHNVGNVLNSINVSATLVADRIRNSNVDGLRRVAKLVQQQAHDLAESPGYDSQGQQLATYLSVLASQLEAEQQSILREFVSLRENVAHIKEIISRQQSYACDNGTAECFDICELIDNAFAICTSAHSDVEVRRYVDDIPMVNLDKHSVMQVLVNLIENAKDALADIDGKPKCIAVRATITSDRNLQIAIEDNGIGIEKTDIKRLFHYAFTTKDNGHGFGLHASAAAVECMRGSLTAHSDGPGHGATFVLKLPLADIASAA